MTEPDRLTLEIDRKTRSIKFLTGADSVPVGTWRPDESRGDPAETERRLGYAILGILSAMTGVSLTGRDYLSDRNGRMAVILQALRKQLNDGDETAVIPMVLEIVAGARRNRDASMLEDAEKVLRDAAVAGNASASAYLASSWSNEKHDATLAIKNGNL